MKVTLVLMEFLQRKYEYSQNIILVNKEYGWVLGRAPLTTLAVGFDSLHPCGNLCTQGTLLQLQVPLLDSGHQESVLFTLDTANCMHHSV